MGEFGWCTPPCSCLGFMLPPPGVVLSTSALLRVRVQGVRYRGSPPTSLPASVPGPAYFQLTCAQAVLTWALEPTCRSPQHYTSRCEQATNTSAALICMPSHLHCLGPAPCLVFHYTCTAVRSLPNVLRFVLLHREQKKRPTNSKSLRQGRGQMSNTPPQLRLLGISQSSVRTEYCQTRPQTEAYTSGRKPLTWYKKTPRTSASCKTTQRHLQFLCGERNYQQSYGGSPLSAVLA